jgi:predicted NAD-dependent protein-ADP-ribosyltransferase YbiA (DUF1768 family)
MYFTEHQFFRRTRTRTTLNPQQPQRTSQLPKSSACRLLPAQVQSPARSNWFQVLDRVLFDGIHAKISCVSVANRKYGQQKSDAKRGRARKSQSPSPSRDEDEEAKEVDEDEIPSSDEIERRATKSYK